MRAIVAIVAVLFAAPRAAQVTVTVGPDPAPLGAPVFASVTNDTNQILGLGGCPWKVFDEEQNLVFEATCLIQELLVGSLGTVSFRWNQVDEGGAAVAAGRYFMEVLTPGGRFYGSFEVGGVDANLHLKGTPAIGTNVIGFGGRPIAVASPQDPGAAYRVLAAFSSLPGIATCGGQLPLARDSLFLASLRGNVVTNATGELDASGYSEAALLPIPDDAALVGIDFVLAFVVLDAGAPCPLRRISPPLALTIAPGPVPFPGVLR